MAEVQHVEDSGENGADSFEGIFWKFWNPTFREIMFLTPYLTVSNENFLTCLKNLDIFQILRTSYFLPIWPIGHHTVSCHDPRCRSCGTRRPHKGASRSFWLSRAQCSPRRVGWSRPDQAALVLAEFRNCKFSRDQLVESQIQPEFTSSLKSMRILKASKVVKRCMRGSFPKISKGGKDVKLPWFQRSSPAKNF